MYVIMWEFIVRPEKVADFAVAYRADGDWAKLFALATGYRGTELLSATDRPDRFVTIDRWDHESDFVRFQQGFADQYKTLDSKLEGFTLLENKLGTFAVDG